ncbi:UNVERIFIED_CONTAM: hypothetical protein K2H54_060302 [Gekko kuhli]
MSGASAPSPSLPPPQLRGDSAQSAAGSVASHKPNKKAKSLHRSSAPTVKDKEKTDKGPKRSSDAPTGPPEPKHPRLSTPAPTVASTPASVPVHPSDPSVPPPEDSRSRQPEWHSLDERRSEVVMIPSRSPSLHSYSPSELFKPDDVQIPSYRDHQDWFQDVESVIHRSRSRSRRPTSQTATRCYFTGYSPEPRSPSPNTYAQHYYASWHFSDPRSRSPLHYSERRDQERRDQEIISPPPRPLRASPRAPPSAALGAPPTLDHGPSDSIEPPLYMPDDLTREVESSPESTDQASDHSDLEKEEAESSPPDSDLGQPGALSPSDGPKSYLQLINRMCQALQVQLVRLFHTTTDQYLTSVDDSRKTTKRLGFFSTTQTKPKQRTKRSDDSAKQSL